MTRTSDRSTVDWPEFVEEWGSPLYSLAYRILGHASDAEDATQEVFVRVFRNFDRYSSNRPLRPWVFRLARNVILNYSRHRQRKRGSERALEAEPLDVCPVESSVEDRDWVSHRLEALDPSDRLLLLLRFHSGLSPSEMAVVLKCPRTTVQSKLERALDRARSADMSSAGSSISSGLALLPVLPPTGGVRERIARIPMESGQALSLPLGVTPWVWTGLLFFVGIGATLLGYWIGHDRDELARIDDRLVQPDVARTAVEGAADPTLAQAEGAATELQELQRRLTTTVDTLERQRKELRELREQENPAADDPSAERDSEAQAWGQFAELFRRYVVELPENNGQTPELGHILLTVQAEREFRVRFASLRERNAYPLFQEEVAVAFFQATYGRTLDCDLSESVRGAFRATLAGFDPHRATPLARLGRVEALQREVTSLLENSGVVLDEERLERTRYLVSQRFLATPQHLVVFSLPSDLSEPRAALLVDRVAEQIDGLWAEYYGSKSRPFVPPLGAAERFLRKAHDALTKHRSFDPQVSWEGMRETLFADILDIQVETEREFPIDSFEGADRRMSPVLRLQFEPGAGFATTEEVIEPAPPAL